MNNGMNILDKMPPVEFVKWSRANAGTPDTLLSMCIFITECPTEQPPTQIQENKKTWGEELSHGDNPEDWSKISCNQIHLRK